MYIVGLLCAAKAIIQNLNVTNFILISKMNKNGKTRDKQSLM